MACCFSWWHISQKIFCCVMPHMLCFKRQKVVLQCVMCLVLQKVVLHRMTTNLGWYLALLSAKWRQTYSSQILYKFWDGNAMLSAKWSISPGDILPPKQYLCPCSNICFHNLKYICLFQNLKYIFLSHYSWKWSIWIHQKQGCVYLCWVPCKALS